jgi:hypothetical protein
LPASSCSINFQGEGAALIVKHSRLAGIPTNKWVMLLQQLNVVWLGSKEYGLLFHCHALPV